MHLYLVTTNDGETFLVNIDPNIAQAMKESGWRVLRLGVAHPDVILGYLAKIDRLDPAFAPHTDNLAV